MGGGLAELGVCFKEGAWTALWRVTRQEAVDVGADWALTQYLFFLFVEAYMRAVAVKERKVDVLRLK